MSDQTGYIATITCVAIAAIAILAMIVRLLKHKPARLWALIFLLSATCFGTLVYVREAGLPEVLLDMPGLSQIASVVNTKRPMPKSTLKPASTTVSAFEPASTAVPTPKPAPSQSSAPVQYADVSLWMDISVHPDYEFSVENGFTRGDNPFYFTSRDEAIAVYKRSVNDLNGTYVADIIMEHPPNKLYDDTAMLYFKGLAKEYPSADRRKAVIAEHCQTLTNDKYATPISSQYSTNLIRKTIQLINQAKDKKDLPAYIKALRELLAKYPLHRDALSDLSVAYLASGEYYPALVLAEYVVALSPGNDIAKQNLLVLDTIAGERGERTFADIYADNPTLTVAGYNAAYMRMEDNDEDGALYILDEIIAAEPNNDKALRLKYYILQNRKGT